MYKQGMILRSRNADCLYLMRLQKRLTHAQYEIEQDMSERHGGNNTGWTYQTYNNWKRAWESDIGWMDETYIARWYDPIGRLTELILGVNET